MLRYETYTRRHFSVRLSLIPGRRNVVLFKVYYCALPFQPYVTRAFGSRRWLYSAFLVGKRL